MISKIFNIKLHLIITTIACAITLFFALCGSSESYTSKNFNLFLDGKKISDIYLENPNYSAYSKKTTYFVTERGKESILNKIDVTFGNEEKDTVLKSYLAQGMTINLEESPLVSMYTRPKLFSFIVSIFAFLFFAAGSVMASVKNEKLDINISPKIHKFIFNKNAHEVILGLLILLSLVFIIFSSTTTYKHNNIHIFLEGKDPKKIVFSNPNYDDIEKTVTFSVNEKGNYSFFKKNELELSMEDKDSILIGFSKMGISLDHRESFILSRVDRPKSLVLILTVMEIFVLLLSLIIKDKEKLNESNNRVVYSSSTGEERSNSSSKEKNMLPKLSFEDVAGIDEVRDQIEEIVQLFKDSSKIQEMGGRIPRGVLLNGPPGTGKTLLAKVTASESNSNFLHASGSEFVEMYVGVGAKRVRDLFSRARQMAPCIVFIDEIDAVAGKRGVDHNSEREQTLNELLVQMDGFASKDNIIVFAATNQLDKLDPAILRPGRFDRQISVFLPDIKGREKILKIYLNKTKTKSVNVKPLARATSGFSGADLSNLVNEAILYAARTGKSLVTQKDLNWAKDKIIMGSERKITMSKEDLKKTAYHEIGHAYLCQNLGLGKLVNVSIVPRGRALGVTQMESEDLYTLSKDRAIDQIAMMMGGRVCEKIFFDHYSTGASNDLQRAFSLARNMVAHWGMSDLGPFGLDETFYKAISESTKAKIEEETLNIVKAAESKAEAILSQYKEEVEKLSEILLDKETLSAKEFEKIYHRART